MEKSEVDKLLESKDIDTTSESPSIIYKKGNVIYVLDEGQIKKYTAEVIESMLTDARRKNDFGVNNVLLQRLIDVKKTWWPATQKSITGNLNFNDTLKTWINERKKAIEDLGEEVPEYEIVNQTN